MKLGIIGAGAVGETVGYTAALLGNAEEIVFYDINKERAISEAMDINDGGEYYPNRTRAVVGDYDSLATCDVLVVCTGLEAEAGDRLNELELNKIGVAKYIREIANRGFDGFYIVVTNPCDVIAYLVYRESGLPANRVIGAGTVLDSTRFNVMLAEELNLSPKSVQGMMLGEHGESQFTPWSQVFIGHIPYGEYKKSHEEQFRHFSEDLFEKRVRARGWDVFSGKGCTQYGIAGTVNRILRSLVKDNREVLNVSTLLQGEYGLWDLYISTPCVVGKNGVEEVLELSLTEEEQRKYRDSAGIIQKHIEQL